MRILKLAIASLSLAACSKVKIPDAAITWPKPDGTAFQTHLISTTESELSKEDLQSLLLTQGCMSKDDIGAIIGVIDKLCGEPELKDVCDFQTKEAIKVVSAKIHKAMAKVPDAPKKRRGRS